MSGHQERPRDIGNGFRDIRYKLTGLQERDFGTSGTNYRDFRNATTLQLYDSKAPFSAEIALNLLTFRFNILTLPVPVDNRSQYTDRYSLTFEPVDIWTIGLQPTGCASPILLRKTGKCSPLPTYPPAPATDNQDKINRSGKGEGQGAGISAAA
jgi:hypothetical protein